MYPNSNGKIPLAHENFGPAFVIHDCELQLIYPQNQIAAPESLQEDGCLSA